MDIKLGEGIHGKRNQQRVDTKAIDEKFILKFKFSKFQKNVMKLVSSG